jgi:hypothetical protein
VPFGLLPLRPPHLACSRMQGLTVGIWGARRLVPPSHAGSLLHCPCAPSLVQFHAAPALSRCLRARVTRWCASQRAPGRCEGAGVAAALSAMLSVRLRPAAADQQACHVAGRLAACSRFGSLAPRPAAAIQASVARHTITPCQIPLAPPPALTPRLAAAPHSHAHACPGPGPRPAPQSLPLLCAG